MNTTKARAYAAQSATSPLVTTTIPRRAPTDRDVQIDILFCGICHSDLHQVRREISLLHRYGVTQILTHPLLGSTTGEYL